MADVRRRRVLPGIARKPQGYTSMQMLAYARNVRENFEFMDANQIARVEPIIQETPNVFIREKNTNNTIWMKMRRLMFSLKCEMIALFNSQTNNVPHLFTLSQLQCIVALLVFLAILTLIAFFIVLYSCCPCGCIRETFYGKPKKPLPWYRSFFSHFSNYD